MKSRIPPSQIAYRQEVDRLSAGYASLGRGALAKMSANEVGMLLAEKSIDLRIANSRLREHPHDELMQLRRDQADAAVNDIVGFIKESRGQTTLEKLRLEIEADTKAAQSEPERLERRRAEKLLGPLELPKQEKKKNAEIER